MTAQRRCGGELMESFALDAQLPTTPPSPARPNSDVDTTAGWVGLENAPSHCKGDGMEPFDIWDAYQLDPFEAHVLRYLVRADRKGSRYNDLRKAQHYTQELILRVERGDIRYMGRLVPRVSARFEPEEVTEAFHLKGHVGSATRLLLHWRTTDSITALYAVRRYIEKAIANEPD